MWHCPYSHAVTAAIYRYLLPAGPTAANPQQWFATDGQRTISQTPIPTPHSAGRLPMNIDATRDYTFHGIIQ